MAGVVVNAATGVEYVATPGEARRDGVLLQARGPAPLHRRLVITGFGYDSAKRAVQAQAVARLLPEVREIRRLCCVACDFGFRREVRRLKSTINFHISTNKLLGAVPSNVFQINFADQRV